MPTRHRRSGLLFDRHETHLLVQMLIFSAVRGGMSNCATFHAAPDPSGALMITSLPCTAAQLCNQGNSLPGTTKEGNQNLALRQTRESRTTASTSCDRNEWHLRLLTLPEGYEGHGGDALGVFFAPGSPG